mgnify:CR=1 FL=1
MAPTLPLRWVELRGAVELGEMGARIRDMAPMARAVTADALCGDREGADGTLIGLFAMLPNLWECTLVEDVESGAEARVLRAMLRAQRHHARLGCAIALVPGWEGVSGVPEL